ENACALWSTSVRDVQVVTDPHDQHRVVETFPVAQRPPARLDNLVDDLRTPPLKRGPLVTPLPPTLPRPQDLPDNPCLAAGRAMGTPCVVPRQLRHAVVGVAVPLHMQILGPVAVPGVPGQRSRDVLSPDPHRQRQPLGTGTPSDLPRLGTLPDHRVKLHPTM